MKTRSGRQGPASKLLIGCGVIAAGVAVWWFLPVSQWVSALSEYIADMGSIGYVAYMVSYVFLASLGVPRTPLNIGAGVIFPFAIGLGLVIAASALTYFTTFQIARSIAQDWVIARLEKIPNSDQLMRAVEEEGFKLVFLIRMNPFIPAILKGYGFGTTSISLGTYLLASVLGSLPIVAAHVYLGWVGGAAMMSGEARPEGVHMTMLWLGAAVSVMAVVAVAWYGRRALTKRTPKSA